MNARLKTAVFIVLGMLAYSACAIGIESAKAENVSQQKVVVHLSHFTDDLHRVFMAVKTAGLLQESGADVTLYLDLEGVRVAERRNHLDMTWGSNPTHLSEYYEQFVRAGGKALLCPHCAKSARTGDLMLKKNAEIGSEGSIARMLLEADKILDY